MGDKPLEFPLWSLVLAVVVSASLGIIGGAPQGIKLGTEAHEKQCVAAGVGRYVEREGRIVFEFIKPEERK